LYHVLFTLLFGRQNEYQLGHQLCEKDEEKKIQGQAKPMEQNKG
jgi:hypothetical protein